MQRASWTVTAAVLAALVGCGGSNGARGPQAAPTSPPASTDGCPEDPGGSGMAAIDYVDFVTAFGRQYVTGMFVGHSKHPPTATRADFGEVVLRSRCAFSEFNDRTHQNPGEPRDGDTGFLPAGTPIHALKGWPTSCRLAAEHDGRISVYLALRNGARQATPRPCAVRQPGGR